MPSWPENRVYIGSRAKRIDGPAKVTGLAKYASDVLEVIRQAGA